VVERLGELGGLGFAAEPQEWMNHAADVEARDAADAAFEAGEGERLLGGFVDGRVLAHKGEERLARRGNRFGLLFYGGGAGARGEDVGSVGAEEGEDFIVGGLRWGLGGGVEEGEEAVAVLEGRDD
jgi:hypothetical protein